MTVTNQHPSANKHIFVRNVILKACLLFIIINLAVSLNGTLSGEHGVGLAKAKFLPLFMDKDTREFMTTIKKAVDPLGILNPGKFVS